MGESVRLKTGQTLSQGHDTELTSDDKILELYHDGRLITFREWATSLGFSHKNPQTWVTKGKMILGQHYLQLSTGNKTRFIWSDHAESLATEMHGRAGRPRRQGPAEVLEQGVTHD